MLARRYEIATGQRQAKDPVAFLATGKMLFGHELWEWVNPNNVASNGKNERGPGRVALEEILRRLTGMTGTNIPSRYGDARGDHDCPLRGSA